jgi:Cysteine-rich secretory protein family
VLDTAGTAKLGADLSCGEFSHTPCGNPFQSVFTDYLAGAAGYGIGENIAWGTGSYGTPRSTMDGWLNSTGHRANILTPSFTELGIGYLPDRSFLGYSGATLWSQEFGTRTPSATSAAPSATPTATAPKAQPKKRAVAPRSRAKRHRVTRRRYRRRP